MRVFILMMFSVLVQTVSAQNGVVYTSFMCLKVEYSIRLEFVLNSGSTCNGIYIERGEDSINLFQIGSIAGSCGSPVEPVNYVYIDENPILNSTNYYRLNFGGADFSEIIGIKYSEVSPKTINVVPNPSLGVFDLNFNNKYQEELQVEILNGVGEAIYKVNTKLEKINIDISSIPQGVYYIRVYSSNNMALINKGVAIIL